MSSLLQFTGLTGHRGVRLELVLMSPDLRYPDNAVLGNPVEMLDCPTCGKQHEQIHFAWRKPVGMLGCWVQFRLNGFVVAPDLSLPIKVFKLPRDAQRASAEENAKSWHS